MSTYCDFCRHSIFGSTCGFMGKELQNPITKEKTYYCYDCYPKAVEILLADLRLNDYLNNKDKNG